MVQVLNTRRTDMVQCPDLFYETLESRMESSRVRTYEVQNDPLVALAQNPELTDMMAATRRLGGDPISFCRTSALGQGLSQLLRALCFHITWEL